MDRHLHLKAIIHKVQPVDRRRLRNIVRNRRRLIQASQLEYRANSFLSTPWPPSSKHLQYDTSQRPDIDFGTVTLTMGADHFRRHPEHGALHTIGDIIAVNVVRFLGYPKIGDFACPIKIEEDIVSLKIPMKDTFSMKVG